jgi:DNA-binding cell septation regulator SpoVG
MSTELEQKLFWLEYKQIGIKLSRFHAIFYKMWTYGRPVLTTKIPTAAALFDRNGQSFKFMFNPDFWAELSDYDRAFVVCHECMHMILNHGLRGQSARKHGRQEQANIAMDLAVNHLLEDHFGFNRKLLGPSLRDKSLFNEDFYPKIDPNIQFSSDDSFEVHYVRISKLIDEGKLKEITVVSFDDHSYLEPNESNGAESKLRATARELNSNEREKLVNSIKDDYKKAGNERGMLWVDINASRPRKKQKWTTCFKKWTHNSLYHDDDREENFMRIDRRFAAMEKTIGNILLPGDNPTYLKKKELKRIQICLFLDVSGSCMHLAEHFVQAARTMPPDRFDIRAFTFDTEVKPINIYDEEIQVGGGTSFTCIEEYIQNNLLTTAKKTYPKCICVYTDGCGDNVMPVHPERWYWFLTDNHSKDCIPKNSNMFHLADFVPHLESI